MAGVSAAASDARDAVDLWLLEPARVAGDLRSILPWLTAAELRRYHAFAFDRHRLEYLATRALVRSVLGRALDRPGAALQFTVNAYGRPALDPPAELFFNLTNHPTLIACAVRRGAELGIDLEPLDRGPSIVELADTVFAPRELAALRALPADAQPDRALSLWTLKEAYIKARGMGLSLALDSFAYAFAADAPGATDAITLAPSPDDARRWACRTLDVLGHRIALALEQRDAPISLHHVTQLDASGMTSHRLA